MVRLTIEFSGYRYRRPFDSTTLEKMQDQENYEKFIAKLVAEEFSSQIFEWFDIPKETTPHMPEQTAKKEKNIKL